MVHNILYIDNINVLCMGQTSFVVRKRGINDAIKQYSIFEVHYDVRPYNGLKIT